MKKVTIFNKFSLFVMLLLTMTYRVNAQSLHPLVPDNYVFDIDSLKGFDDDMAKQMALNTGHFGDEFKVYMYFLKREYIQAKYNLPLAGSNFKGVNPNPNPLVAACVNEDFEDQSLTNPVPSTVVVSTAAGINGWTSSSGINSGSIGSCNLAGCCPSAPQSIRVISPPAGGLIDALIGPSYPIRSVFGTYANTGGTGGPGFAVGIDTMRGSWFCKINEQTGNANFNKISKTINVTPSNALFQFAFISVIEGAHCCCDNAGFSLKVKDCSNNVLACPQFTASPPQASYCSGGVTPCTYPAGGASIYQTTPMNPNWKYNPWKLTTLDLTSYIGSCVTIDVVGIDCTAGGHGGYVYFDAQCQPMAILGNGTSFPAGTPNITLPTCGTGNTATVTAPPGAGPYSWVGPTGFIPTTAQTFTTSITGNYTLTMSPPGACAPIVRTVSVVITPAPNLILSGQTQFACATPTDNAASITMSSGTPITTITPNYSVSWSPAPAVVSGSTATTYSVTGLTVGINTVTITDAVGCTATINVTVTPAPPVPSFSIDTPQGTVVGCVPPTITLNAINTSTLPNMTYTWTSPSTGTATGASINGSAPTGTNVYTVYGQDASVGSCIVSTTVQITQNTTPPGCSVTPTSGTLTCNGAPVTFTATSSSTTNIVGQWFDQNNAPMNLPSGTPMLASCTQPGTYVATYTNIANGCTSTQSVTVSANIIVPTMTVNAPFGYTLTCNQPNLPFSISASSTVAPQIYTWINMNVTPPTTVTPATGAFSVSVPGTYIAGYKDGNLCQIYQQITVSIDTVKPVPTATTNLAGGSFTLNCYSRTLTATAMTSPMLPATSYSWTQPSPSLVVATQNMVVNTTSVTTNPTTFTVMAKGANGCIGRQKINFYKDTIQPKYKVVFTPTAITCANQNVAVSIVATGSPTGAVTFTVMSPPPTTTATTSGALFSIPGPYNSVVMLASNGCTANAVSAILSTNDTPPAIIPVAPAEIPCGAPTITVNAGVVGSTSGLTYAWSGPPGAGISTPTANSTGVNTAGEYEVVITNTVNGCSSVNTVAVSYSSVLPVSFTADSDFGYAPLTVNFDNTSSLTGGASSTVTTLWGYGNGVATTSVQAVTGTGTPNAYDGQTTFNAAGTYTVWLSTSQYIAPPANKTCSGTASLVITVDMPSQLTVPNVFTPNGDKVNDTFFLNTTNLKEVSCLIFDRWGVKMYDVTSETGNISWDGKNLSNKEVPVGTYFYIIKGTGKDGTAYEQKGTVSLYR